MNEINLERRAFLQTTGFIATNTILSGVLPNRGKNLEATSSLDTIYNPAFEAFSNTRPVEDYLITTLQGKAIVEKLLDPTLLSFASNINRIDLSYLDNDSNISGSMASFISYQRYSVGEHYDLIRGFYPDHAHFNVSPNSSINAKLGDLRVLGSVYSGDENNRAKKFSDIVEGWFFVNKALEKPKASYKIITVTDLIASEETLLNKDIFAIGFPVAYEKKRNGSIERYTIPMKFGGLSYEIDSQGIKRPYTKFYPSADLDPSTLPGLSGGALGYLDEDGTFILISSVYGYEPGENYYLIGSPLQDNCMADENYKDPWKSTVGWNVDLVGSLVFNKVANLDPINNLISFLIENSNYPPAHLERMLTYASEISNNEDAIIKSMIYNKKPSLLIKGLGDKKYLYSWNDDILHPRFVRIK